LFPASLVCDLRARAGGFYFVRLIVLDAIDKWRAKQRPIPNVSDAIRQLIEDGLKATIPKSGKN
jgi:hypothetical protein